MRNGAEPQTVIFGESASSYGNGSPSSTRWVSSESGNYSQWMLVIKNVEAWQHRVGRDPESHLVQPHAQCKKFTTSPSTPPVTHPCSGVGVLSSLSFSMFRVYKQAEPMLPAWASIRLSMLTASCVGFFLSGAQCGETFEYTCCIFSPLTHKQAPTYPMEVQWILIITSRQSVPASQFHPCSTSLATRSLTFH